MDFDSKSDEGQITTGVASKLFLNWKKFAENRREICVFYLSNIYFLFEMWRAVFDVFYVMLFSGCYSHNKTMNAAD